MRIIGISVTHHGCLVAVVLLAGTKNQLKATTRRTCCGRDALTRDAGNAL
jgi:hypothetical protein